MLTHRLAQKSFLKLFSKYGSMYKSLLSNNPCQSLGCYLVGLGRGQIIYIFNMFLDNTYIAGPQMIQVVSAPHLFSLSGIIISINYSRIKMAMTCFKKEISVLVLLWLLMTIFASAASQNTTKP